MDIERTVILLRGPSHEELFLAIIIPHRVDNLLNGEVQSIDTCVSSLTNRRKDLDVHNVSIHKRPIILLLEVPNDTLLGGLPVTFHIQNHVLEFSSNFDSLKGGVKELFLSSHSVGRGQNAGLLSLTVNLFQSHIGNQVALHHISGKIQGPDGFQLSWVAQHNELMPRGNGL